eukprot:scaffold6894_cov104-Isochrysis_galbana.AAC.3
MVASGSSGSPSSDSASSFNPSHSPLDPAARAPPAAPPPSSPPSPAVPSSDRSTSLPNQRALTAINVRSIEVPMYAQLRPCSRRCRIRSSSALVHRLFSLPPLPPPSAELACSPAPLRGLAPAGRASTGGAPYMREQRGQKRGRRELAGGLSEVLIRASRNASALRAQRPRRRVQAGRVWSRPGAEDPCWDTLSPAPPVHGTQVGAIASHLELPRYFGQHTRTPPPGVWCRARGRSGHRRRRWMQRHNRSGGGGQWGGCAHRGVAGRSGRVVKRCRRAARGLRGGVACADGGWQWRGSSHGPTGRPSVLFLLLHARLSRRGLAFRVGPLLRLHKLLVCPGLHPQLGGVHGEAL